LPPRPKGIAALTIQTPPQMAATASLSQITRDTFYGIRVRTSDSCRWKSRGDRVAQLQAKPAAMLGRMGGGTRCADMGCSGWLKEEAG
jgi:hypothetical protein